MSSKGYTSSYRGTVSPKAYALVLAADFGAAQNTLPSIPESGSFDYCFKIPNSGELWRVQESVHFARPDATLETADVAITTVDVKAPVNPGWNGTTYSAATLTGKALTDAGCTPAIYMVLNGVLYQATNTGSGTQSVVPLAPGAFNQTKGATTTDGTVTWTSCGKAILIVARFVNNNAGSSETPAAMQYDFWAA